MKISDIRTKDIVKIKNLSEEDKVKIMKFASKISQQEDEMYDYLEGFLYIPDEKLYNFEFRVNRCGQTKKVPTEYAYIATLDQVLVPIQTRYLKMIRRTSKHPLTNIFA